MPDLRQALRLLHSLLLLTMKLNCPEASDADRQNRSLVELQGRKDK